jgi:hypothetical protein
MEHNDIDSGWVQELSPMDLHHYSPTARRLCDAHQHGTLLADAEYGGSFFSMSFHNSRDFDLFRKFIFPDFDRLHGGPETTR